MPPLKQKTITISCETPDAEIRYEYSEYGIPDDCPEPTEESTLYTEPIITSRYSNTSNYIKAKAFKAGMTPSDTVGAKVDFSG